MLNRHFLSTSEATSTQAAFLILRSPASFFSFYLFCLFFYKLISDKLYNLLIICPLFECLCSSSLAGAQQPAKGHSTGNYS